MSTTSLRPKKQVFFFSSPSLCLLHPSPSSSAVVLQFFFLLLSLFLFFFFLLPSSPSLSSRQLGHERARCFSLCNNAVVVSCLSSAAPGFQTHSVVHAVSRRSWPSSENTRANMLDSVWTLELESRSLQSSASCPSDNFIYFFFTFSFLLFAVCRDPSSSRSHRIESIFMTLCRPLVVKRRNSN